MKKLLHNDPKAQDWIDSEIDRIQKEYGLSDSKAEDCSYNAESSATDATTAEEWVGLFEASIY